MIAKHGGLHDLIATNFATFSWRRWEKAPATIHAASSDTKIKRGTVFGLKPSADKTYYGILVFPENRYKLLGVRDKTAYEFLLSGSTPAGTDSPITKNQNGFVRLQKFRRYFIREFRRSYLAAATGADLVALAKRLDAVLLATLQFYAADLGAEAVFKPHPAQDRAARPLFNYLSTNAPIGQWKVTNWNPLAAKPFLFSPAQTKSILEASAKQNRYFIRYLAQVANFLTEGYLRANALVDVNVLRQDLIFTFAGFVSARFELGTTKIQPKIKSNQLRTLLNGLSNGL